MLEREVVGRVGRKLWRWVWAPLRRRSDAARGLMSSARLCVHLTARRRPSLVGRSRRLRRDLRRLVLEALRRFLSRFVLLAGRLARRLAARGGGRAARRARAGRAFHFRADVS